MSYGGGYSNERRATGTVEANPYGLPHCGNLAPQKEMSQTTGLLSEVSS